MEEQIYARVRAFVKKNSLFDNCCLVVAGVSGGGDSMTMLDILRRLQEEYGYILRAVHVNHGIRGAEADRDQRLVEETCRLWNVPCSVYRFDVPALSVQWKNGLEEAGRKVRQEAFCQEIKKTDVGMKGKRLIAVAHNKNDLAETMLHHLCRGTGLRGLSPMSPKKRNIIRPVLCLERNEIDQYLMERKVPNILDSSNLEDDYTRNRIRHHLLPLLEEEINSRTITHMSETAELIGQAEEFLSKQGRSLAEESYDGKDTCLFQDSFFEKDEILKKYAVREAFEILAGIRQDLSMLHIRMVLDLYECRTGARVCLPYGMTGERTYDGVRLGRQKKDEKTEKIQLECFLPIPGRMECDYGSFETQIFSWSDQKICEKKYTKWLDYDRIKYDISVRTRKTGDHLTVNEKGDQKKLTRCMIDEKIPRESRDRIPLLTIGNEVLWIIGSRINEKYKITSKTKNVLEIKYQGGKCNE